MDAEIAALVIAGLAFFAAAVSACYAKRQVAAARDQAESARKYVVAARDQAESARKQVEISEKVRKDSAQPYVFVDIRQDERFPYILNLVVINQGATVAENVRLTFSPPLASVEFPKAPDSPALKSGIASLPPGGSREFRFDGYGRFKSDLDRMYRVTVDGEGPYGPLALEYVLDLTDFENVRADKVIGAADVVSSLDGIAKAVKGVGRKFDARVSLLPRKGVWLWRSRGPKRSAAEGR